MAAPGSLRLGHRLYDVKVRPWPALTMGQLRGPLVFMVDPPSSLDTNQIDKRHLSFSRSWYILRAYASELIKVGCTISGGVSPYAHCLINRAAAQPLGSLWQAVLVDNAANRAGNRQPWTSDVCCFQGNVQWQDILIRAFAGPAYEVRWCLARPFWVYITRQTSPLQLLQPVLGCANRCWRPGWRRKALERNHT